MQLSLLRPLTGGRVTQWFGANPAAYATFGLPGHNGLDYSAKAGTPIVAAHAGILRCWPVDPTGFGLYVTVVATGYYTLYAHLSAIIGADGEQIEAGELVGFSGNTGYSTGPHLHFGLRIVRSDAAAQPYKGWADPWPFRD